MKYIILRGKYAEGIKILVDNDIYKKHGHLSWQRLKNNLAHKDRIYARRTEKGKTVLLHRLILNAPPELEVDHINGDMFDCRRTNLRLCTHAQNQQNKNKKRTTIGFKGIRRHHHRWVARIIKNGKEFHIGSFINEEQAAVAYNQKAKELFGEFARLNVIK